MEKRKTKEVLRGHRIKLINTDVDPFFEIFTQIVLVLPELYKDKKIFL
jgi:hypothetical protein